MMIILIISTILLSSVPIHALDWTNILKADISCCRQHSTSRRGCIQEPGSNCMWLPADNPIAIKYESQCLGSRFVQCKQQNIRACCGICYGPPETTAPNNGFETSFGPEPPNCGPPPTLDPTNAPTTTPSESPTAEPTIPKCEMCPYPGGNTQAISSFTTYDPFCYYFEGFPCVVSGDPHFKQWNANTHDYQGQPTTDFGTDALTTGYKNQHYYVTNCASATRDNIPFSILGTQYPFRRKMVNSVDYIVLELYESDQEMYFVYLSANIASYGLRADDVLSDYDATVDLGGELFSLVSGVPELIGSRFVVEYIKNSDIQLDVTLTIDEQNTVKIIMEATNNPLKGRYRMHYVHIEQAEAYKCFTCGLCGNFKIPSSLEPTEVSDLELCDGSVASVRTGSEADETPEAYDPDGWTWQRDYKLNQCSAYNLTDNNGDFVGTPLCPSEEIKVAVKNSCAQARLEQESCCANFEMLCDSLQNDCELDACIDSRGDINKVDMAVDRIFRKTLRFVCSRKEFRRKFKEDKLKTRTPRPTKAPAVPRSKRAKRRRRKKKGGSAEQQEEQEEAANFHVVLVEEKGYQWMSMAAVLAGVFLYCIAQCFTRRVCNKDELYVPISDPVTDTV